MAESPARRAVAGTLAALVPRSAAHLAAAVATLAAALAPARPLPAQGTPRGRRLGVFMAVSHDQPLKTRVGRTHDRDLYFTAIRWTWPLAGHGRTRLDYTADALPAVISTAMPEYLTTFAPAACVGEGKCRPGPSTERVRERTVYGFGVQPLGLQLRVAVGPRLALLARGAAGPVWFRHAVPDPRETRLNFAEDVGVGAELTLARALRLSAAYRLDHISNGGMGKVNPGMNSNMLEVGVSWAR